MFCLGWIYQYFTKCISVLYPTPVPQDIFPTWNRGHILRAELSRQGFEVLNLGLDVWQSLLSQLYQQACQNFVILSEWGTLVYSSHRVVGWLLIWLIYQLVMSKCRLKKLRLQLLMDCSYCTDSYIRVVLCVEVPNKVFVWLCSKPLELCALWICV